MDQPHPIDTLLQRIHTLESALEAVNSAVLLRTDMAVQADFHVETQTIDTQTDIGFAYFEQIRPKTRSSGPPSKPSTPLSRGSRKVGKGQILMDEGLINAVDVMRKTGGKSSRGTKGSSPRDFMNSRGFDIPAKQSRLRRREADEPLVMKSVYKHDPSPNSASFLAEDLTNVSPINSIPSRPHLPAIPKAPSTEIKAMFKQAISRMKDDFEIM